MAGSNYIARRGPMSGLTGMLAPKVPTTPHATAPAPAPAMAGGLPPPSLAGNGAAAPAAAVGGDGGAKIVEGAAATPSMQALAGDSSYQDPGGSAESIGGPNQYRQGIGKRIFPQDSAALAALRQVY